MDNLSPIDSSADVPTKNYVDLAVATLAEIGGIYGSATRSGNVTLTSGVFTGATGWTAEGTVPSAGSGWSAPTIGTSGVTITDMGMYLVKAAVVVAGTGASGVANNEYVMEPTIDTATITGQSGQKFYLPTGGSPEFSGMWLVPNVGGGVISVRIRCTGTGTMYFGAGRLIVVGPINRYV